MSEPFLAEIRMMGFNFAPRGWAFTDGQILPINQNQSLYSILGTTYGGDGRTTFALPDLRSRTPIHRGEGHSLGQKSGEETHTLSNNEMPEHTHYVRANSTPANQTQPTSHFLSAPASPGNQPFRDYEAVNATSLRSGTVTNSGGSQAHENMQPYITLTFCIALQGLFPSRN
ncbi:phage tail protein [Woodsholea maritima]|uniref:phage tail protein n=1 Tax=Woodsholea maritima TaxID=240237 RepID=UPI000379341B|nr:tail fiber protein [Woodsholea maritima]